MSENETKKATAKDAENQVQGVEAPKNQKPPKLETIEIVGPCGEDNPCGGGFLPD